MFWEALGHAAFCDDRHLEGEVKTAADHPEIIPGAVDYSETQVVSPTDVPGQSDFETGSKLRKHFGLAAEVVGLRIDKKGVWRPLRMKLVPFAAAAPGVIAANVTVVGTEHRTAFTSALNDVDQ